MEYVKANGIIVFRVMNNLMAVKVNWPPWHYSDCPVHEQGHRLVKKEAQGLEMLGT